MNYRVIGAACIIAACGVWGGVAAGQYTQKISLLRQMRTLMDYFECELRYRNLPLPQLIRQASEQVTGKLRMVLLCLSEELDAQVRPNAQCCMMAALQQCREIPMPVYQILMNLGTSLGKYDTQGQLIGVEAARAECVKALDTLERDCQTRVRSLKTLGLCAGAAIVILFI